MFNIIQQESAILGWFNMMLNKKNKELINFVQDGSILEIFQKMVGFKYVKLEQKKAEWELYVWLRGLYNNLKQFNSVVLGKGMNKEVDVIGIIYKKDRGQLLLLIKLFIWTCILVQNRQQFIKMILKLNKKEQIILMDIIKSSNLIDIRISPTINQFLQKIDKLEVQNDQLLQILQQKQQKIKNLSIINTQINHQISKYKSQMQKAYIKCQQLTQSIEKQKSYSQHQSYLNIIQNLKNQLYQSEKRHLQKVSSLNQTIQFLQNAKNNYIQNNNHKNNHTQHVIITPKQSHPPCIPLQKHHQLIKPLYDQINHLTKIQYTKNIQLLKKDKIIETQIKQINTIQKQLKNQSDPLLNKVDYEDVKQNILVNLLNGFKNQIQAHTKNSTNKSQFKN